MSLAINAKRLLFGTVILLIPTYALADETCEPKLWEPTLTNQSVKYHSVYLPGDHTFTVCVLSAPSGTSSVQYGYGTPSASSFQSFGSVQRDEGCASWVFNSGVAAVAVKAPSLVPGRRIKLRICVEE